MRKSRDSVRNTVSLRDVGEGQCERRGAAQKKVPNGWQKYKKSRDRLELIAAFRGVRR